MKKKKMTGLLMGAVIAAAMTGCGQTAGTQQAQTAETQQAQNAGTQTAGTAGAQAEETGGAEIFSEEDGQLTENGAETGDAVEEDIFAGIETAANGAGVSVHDPSIKVFDGTYYIYGSHMTGRIRMTCSPGPISETATALPIRCLKICSRRGFRFLTMRAPMRTGAIRCGRRM